jgi:hypothetical protein
VAALLVLASLYWQQQVIFTGNSPYCCSTGRIFRHPRSTSKGPRMSRKKSLVSPLASRKQVLIAEGELNRVQLSEEWQTITHGIVDLAHRAKTT